MSSGKSIAPKVSQGNAPALFTQPRPNAQAAPAPPRTPFNNHPARPPHAATPSPVAPGPAAATQPAPPRVNPVNPQVHQALRPQTSAKPQAQQGAAPKAYFTHPKKADLREYGHINARTASVPRGSTVDAPLDPRYFPPETRKP